VKISTETTERLSDFRSWNEGKCEADRISLLTYATFVATPDLLFAFASLFFCELVEVEKHYFIKDRFDVRVYEDWKKRLDDPRAIQRVMNHIHISTLLQNADVDEAQARSCAELLAAAWNEVHLRRGATAEVHGTTLEDLSVTLVNLHE
jgi:hypothetical protein